MIKTYNQVPSVYYKESRDFQLLGRIFDVVFNYLKSNINSIYYNPLSDNVDKNLLDLVAYTLGFESKHNYDLAQLNSICKTFNQILRCKGTLKSVELTVKALLNAQGIHVRPSILINTDGELEIRLSSRLLDLTLLYDILEYILPAGLIYHITSIADTSQSYTTQTYSGLDSSDYDSVTDEATEQTYNQISKNYNDSNFYTTPQAGSIDNITVAAIVLEGENVNE